MSADLRFQPRRVNATSNYSGKADVKMRSVICAKQTASKEGGRTAGRVRTDNCPARRGARRAGYDRAAHGGQRERRGLCKQYRGEIKVEHEVNVRGRQDVRLGFDILDTDGRGTAFRAGTVRWRGGSTQAATCRTGTRAIGPQDATGARGRSFRGIALMLHGAAGRTGMSIQALPRGLGYHRHRKEGHAEYPGDPFVTVRTTSLHRISTIDKIIKRVPERPNMLAIVRKNRRCNGIRQ